MGAALLFFLSFQIFSVATSYINSDNAIVGLAAQDTLKGRVPVFFYGQSYMGAVEIYLTALIFFIFGSSSFTLQLAPLVFALLFIGLLYLLARNMLGRPAAQVAILLLLLGPTHFQAYAHATKGGYVETLFFGTGMLWLVHRIYWTEKDRPRKSGLYFFLGVFGGLGFWTNPLVVSYLITVVAVILVKDRKVFFRKDFLFLILGVLAGALPFWIYNFQNHFISLRNMFWSSGQISRGIIRSRIFNVFFYQLPKFMGWEYSGRWRIVSYLGCLGLAAVFFWLLSFSKRRLTSDGLNIILFLVPVVFAVCVFSRFGDLGVPRYILPFYTAYPLLLVAAGREVWRRRKWLAVWGLAVLILPNFPGYVKRMDPALVRKNLVNESGNYRVIDFLNARGISKVYCERWLSDRLTFLSRGRIVAASFYKERQGENGQLVNAAEKPVFIFYRPGDFEGSLMAAGGSFQKKTLEFPTLDEQFQKYIIYYNFLPPAATGREINPEEITARSSSSQNIRSFILDRDYQTCWQSPGLLTPGDYIQLDFGRSRPVVRLDILPEQYSLARKGVLGGFEIMASENGRSWKKIGGNSRVLAPLFWSGTHPFYQEEYGRLSFCLNGFPARYLKIVQTQSSRVNHWVIRELFVYEPDRSGPQPDYQTGELLEFLSSKKPAQVAADYWLSSFINLSSGGRIRTLKAINEILYEEKINSVQNQRMLEVTPGTIFVVKPDEAAALEKVLKEITLGFKKNIIDGWQVYYDLKLKPGSNRRFFWSGTHLLKIGLGN